MSVGNTVHYAAVEMLLKYGADPTVKDNGGQFPVYTFGINPKLQQMFHESYKKNVKDEMKDPECNVCEAMSGTTKKCTGCFKVWYCGAKCQREDWAQHKDQCQKTKSEYKIGRHDAEFVSTFGGMSKSGITDPPGINKNLTKKHFTVKVQISFVRGKPEPDYDEGLNVYNEDKSFHIWLRKKGNEVLHKKLMQIISSKGYRGLKGYFHAILEPGDKEANQFRINPENIFIEPW